MRSERGICRAVDEGGAHASSEQQASYHERLLPRVKTRFLGLFYTRCPNFQTIGTEHTHKEWNYGKGILVFTKRRSGCW